MNDHSNNRLFIAMTDCYIQIHHDDTEFSNDSVVAN